MKTSKLVEMLEYYDTFSDDPNVMVDLGGRLRTVTGVIDNQEKDQVIIKLSDRPSEKQYFVMEDGEDGYTEISSVETSLVNIATLAEMYPDSIYFEATLVT